MDPSLINTPPSSSLAALSSYALPEIWSLDSGGPLGIHPGKIHFAHSLGFPDPLAAGSNRDGSAEESSVTEHSGSRAGDGRKRRDAAAATSEDETSKLLSSSSGGNEMTNSNGKRVKVGGPKGENGNSMELEANSGNSNKTAEPNTQPSEAPKDYIHVRARRGQATDSHSLAERARREKISERMKTLQDLVPGCNKVIGKASVLDEIINYIQSLQRQVDFLSMKLEAVNSRFNSSMEAFPTKDFGLQTFDTAAMGSNSQGTREYGQGSTSEWLHMQVGGGLERTT